MKGFRRLAFIWMGSLTWLAAAMAQEATIAASSESYAGQEVRLRIRGVPYLSPPLVDTLVHFDRKGHFEAILQVAPGSLVRLSTGIYEGSLLVDPGNSYEVVFPPFRELPYAERMSPYFEPLRISLKTLSPPGDVNQQIYLFDSLFYPVNEHVVRMRMRNESIPVDSLIAALRTTFAGAGNTWFRLHMQYKFGILVLNAGETGLERISQDYLGPRVREDHPTYMELFSAMFRDFLVYFDRTRDGGGTLYHINRTHQLDSLRMTVRRHPAITSDTLCDLLLLQELPRLFYRGDFHQQAILILLDSLSADPSKEAYGMAARRIRDRLSSLVIGHEPPEFSLTGTDGRVYTTESFRGKYTYLMFCTPDHYGCMMEYPFLMSYLQKHAEYLNVVTVMVAENPELVKDFMKRNQYAWTALYGGGAYDLLNDYLVRAFPVAYLLGPEGKLILSPAPAPTDGFEQQLFRIMRARGDI